MKCSICKKESNALTMIGGRFVCTSCNYNLQIERYKYYTLVKMMDMVHLKILSKEKYL